MLELQLLPPTISPGRAFFVAKAQREAAISDGKDNDDAGITDNVLYSDGQTPGILAMLRELKLAKQGIGVASNKSKQSMSESPKTHSRMYCNSSGPSSLPPFGPRPSLVDDHPSAPPEYVIDELTWSGATLVWSIGSAIYRTYTFEEEQRDDQHIRQAMFAWFEVPALPSDTKPVSASGVSSSTTEFASSVTTSSDADSLLGPFRPTMPQPWSDNATASIVSAHRARTHSETAVVRVLCVLFRDIAYLYYPSGHSHSLAIPWPWRTALALERGLLFERSESEVHAMLRKYGKSLLDDKRHIVGDAAPRFYVLMDPFEEFEVVRKASKLANIPPSAAERGHNMHHNRSEKRNLASASGITGPFVDGNEYAVYATDRRDGSEPIIVSFNSRERQLSIWAYASVVSSATSELDAYREQMKALLAGGSSKESHGESPEEDDETPRPSSYTSTIGKRRRSADTPTSNGATHPPAPGTPLTVITTARYPCSAILPNPRDQQTSHEGTIMARRRSALGAAPSRAALDPNTSIAGFLDSMGTIPATRSSSSRVSNPASQPFPSGTAMTGRRTSTAASLAPHMDRRASSTRTELSLSLDRMALGTHSMLSQGRAHASNTVPQSTAAAVAALPGSQGSSVGSVLEDPLLLAGRRTPVPGETSISDGAKDIVKASHGPILCFSRLYKATLDVPSDSYTLTTVEVFDVRDGRAILAVHVADINVLYMYTISRSEPRPGQHHTILCSPLRQMEAVSIGLVVSTRPDVRDLLVTDKSGRLRLLTADSLAMEILLLDRNMQGLASLHIVSCGSPSVQLSDNSGKDCRGLDLSMHHHFPLLQDILFLLSICLPVKTFILLYSAILRHSSKLQPFLNPSGIVSILQHVLISGEYQGEQGQHFTDWQTMRSLSSLAGPLSSSLFDSVSQAPVLSYQQLQSVLLCLRLLGQECKCLSRRQRDHFQISKLQDAIGNRLKQLSLQHGELSAADSDLAADFDIFAELSGRMKNGAVTSPIDAFDRMIESSEHSMTSFFTQRETFPVMRTLLKIYDLCSTKDPALLGTCTSRAEAIVLRLAAIGWTLQDLSELSIGVVLPIREAIRQCQLKPPEQWPVAAYALMQRSDQIAQVKGPAKKRESSNVKKRIVYSIDTLTEVASNTKPIGHPVHHIKKRNKDRASRFSSDLRLEDVHRMLHYSAPLITKGPTGPNLTEATLPAEQQKMLLALAFRTLSLPIGNALYLFRVAARPKSHATSIPKIELSARLLPHPGTLSVSSEDISIEHKFWPFFHSGVAVALHIEWTKDMFDSSEYAFNKPSELSARHAGFLYGLGLSGQLQSLDTYQAFKYMDPKHESTSIGLLLGLGATYMGTADVKVTSAMTVHVAALHPPSAAQLNVSHLIQSAGLVGIGLLHVGSRNHRLASNILYELTRTRKVDTEHPDGCREGYALGCAFGYGLVMLGRGTEETGPSGAETLRTLRYLLEGGHNSHLPAARKKTEGPLDVDTTSPAAGIALALSFMRSNRHDVASMLEIPQSRDRLDHVRNDLMLTRTVCKALIMWESIQLSTKWIESLVPSFILVAVLTKNKTSSNIPSDEQLAYWSILAGACLSIGLKYAGSARGEAHTILIEAFDRLSKAANSVPATASLRSKLAKHSLNVCVGTVCLALSAVMAGTGELNVLRRLRVLHGQISTHPSSYGTHVASHMALGLLFMGKGKYTLSTSKTATAVLFCAFYPAFPLSPGDNRFHLQAFRHLWVLAAEPRCLLARDVDTGTSVYLPLRLRVRERDDIGNEVIRSSQMVAPTLIPEMHNIISIQTDSPRYWPVNLTFAESREQLSRFLRGQTLYIKRRAGHSSYASDPRGIRSVFTQPGTELVNKVNDNGVLQELLRKAVQSIPDAIDSFLDSQNPLRAEHKYLCDFDPSRQSSESLAFSAFFGNVVMECLTQDKPEAVTIYRILHFLRRSAQRFSASTALRLEELSCCLEFYSKGAMSIFDSTSNAWAPMLVGTPFVNDALTERRSRLARILLDADTRSALHHHLRCDTDNASYSSEPHVELLRKVLPNLRLPRRRILRQMWQMATKKRESWSGSPSDFKVWLAFVLHKTLAHLDMYDETVIEVLSDAWSQ